MKFPSGLPIGESWIEAPATAPVVFPYDGSTITEAPVGTTDLARQALDHAIAPRTRQRHR